MSSFPMGALIVFHKREKDQVIVWLDDMELRTL